MLTNIKTTQRRDHTKSSAEGRREKTDRRQKAEKLITLLDRRNIRDRRDTKDRRFSKNKKTFLFTVTQQGITIKELNYEKAKLTKLISLIVTTGNSLPYSELVQLLKDVYFAFRSQSSKEQVLCEWYEETIKYSKSNLEDDILITQLNFILKQEVVDILDVLDSYLSLHVDLDENRKSFIQNMKGIQETLKINTVRKCKYIYPHYEEVLSLS